MLLDTGAVFLHEQQDSGSVYVRLQRFRPQLRFTANFSRRELARLTCR
jgi:hypothetical protein